MTDAPRISIAAKLSAIGRASGRLNGSCPQATRGEITEEIRLLDAVSDTLRLIEDYRDVVVAAILAEKSARNERGE